MSAATPGPAWQRVLDARAALKAAHDRLAELESERRAGDRVIPRVEAELRDLIYDAEFEGRDVDPDAENELRQRLMALEALYKPQEGGGYANQETQARLAAAREAILARERELELALRHLEELSAELTAEAVAARDAIVAALPALRELQEAYIRSRAKWRAVCEVNGIPFDMPGEPWRLVEDPLSLHGVALQVPAALLDPNTSRRRPGITLEQLLERTAEQKAAKAAER